MPARHYQLVCDSSGGERMRQRLVRQKIRSVALSPTSVGLDKSPNIYSELTVVKSPRAPMYEIQYMKTKQDGLKQVPVVRPPPKKPSSRIGGERTADSKDGAGKPEIDETGSHISDKRDVLADDMVGLRVIACNKKDGLYYPGTVANHLESTYAVVNFNFNKRQKVRTHMIIPMSGAIPRPELAPGDFVLVKVFKQYVSLDCYVPAIIEFVPEDFRTNTKFYSVLLYNGQRASTMRKFIVKIGRSRFEMAVNYIAHIQSVERQKSALSDITPRSQDTPSSKTTSHRTDKSKRSDRSEDSFSDHSSVRSSEQSSIRSGSERGRKKKEKYTKKLVQKQKDSREKTKSRHDVKAKKHSRSSSRSSSRSKSRSTSRSKSRSTSRSKSRSKSRSTSRSKSRSHSRSRSRSGSDSERTHSRSSKDSRASSERGKRWKTRSKRKSSPKSESRSKSGSRSNSERRHSRSSKDSWGSSKRGSRRKSRSKQKSRSRSKSRSPTSPRSYTSRSHSRSRSEMSDVSWRNSTNERRARSSSGSSTVKSRSRSPSIDQERTPRAMSPIERPSNPVPKPRPISRSSEQVKSTTPRTDIYVERSRGSYSQNSSAAVQLDEKDQMIGDLQHQLDKQLRKQMRQERRLIRQARKINKIQRKLKHSDHNDSLHSDKTDKSRSVKSSSDTDGSPRRRKESPDGTSYRDSPDLRSFGRPIPGLDFDKEVLARWSDDGWYYRGRVMKSDNSRIIVKDTMGHIEEIQQEDILTEEAHRFDVVQPQDCVIALHPKYVFSYAPGEILHIYDNSNVKVEFYDGTLSKLSQDEVYKITRDKYKKDVEYIVDKEKEIVGKSVVARDDRSGAYRLGVVDSRVGMGQQYYLKWLDGEMCKQTSTHIFEVSLRKINSEMLEHVLAPTDGRCIQYKPAVVLQREPLQLQFFDGYSNPDVRKEQCFWINKEYYLNAVEFLFSRHDGYRS